MVRREKEPQTHKIQKTTHPSLSAVLVQDKANGRVITVVDNRAALTAARLSGSKEGMEAMTNLLKGGKQ